MTATIPLADQIACVEREIAMRRAVYANRVRDRKMTQVAADTEIGRMAAVLATLLDHADLAKVAMTMALFGAHDSECKGLGGQSAAACSCGYSATRNRLFDLVGAAPEPA